MKYRISILLIITALLCTVTKINGQTQVDPTSGITTDSLKTAIENQRKEIASKLSTADISSFIIHADENKFGYYIFINGEMVIEQRSIPATGGNTGFINEKDAAKVAELVISKLKAGEMPPSVSPEELKLLQITTVTE